MTVGDGLAIDAGVLVALITTAGAVTAAMLTLYAKLREISATMGRTETVAAEGAADARIAREQVANTHSSNLREDLDAIARDVRQLKRAATIEHAEIWAAITGDRPDPTTGGIPAPRKDLP